jgi:3',5'-cyclic-AMP phosphodiesterase
VPQLTTTPATAGEMLAIDLEVVTVTDTSAVVTWFTGSATETDAYGRPAPVPADTELMLGEPGRPATMRAVLHDTAPTAFHYAEVTGLEPGRSYGFQARSGGLVAVQTSLQFPGEHGSFDIPGMFTTLATPPGTHLFTVALAGDTHVGETASGIIAGGWPPAMRQDPGLPPYPEVMLNAMLDDLRRPDRGASALIIAGDTTAEATPGQVARVRQMLDGWGQLGGDYFAIRGNHDRPHTGAAHAPGSPVPYSPRHHDCWGDVFGCRRQQLSSHQIGGLRVIGLDTTRLDAASGALSQAQLHELEALLAGDRDRPTLMSGHHPVTYESAVTTGAGPAFNLDQKDARALEELYGRAPGVFLHHSGHTHRNKRTAAAAAPRVEFLEVGAVKEYPGGYCLLRLHSGGYMVNFYKTRTDLARRWSQRTRGEYFGLFAHYALGTIADRNHVVTRDLSGLGPAR